jgi:hypothetical protein
MSRSTRSPRPAQPKYKKMEMPMLMDGFTLSMQCIARILTLYKYMFHNHTIEKGFIVKTLS